MARPRKPDEVKKIQGTYRTDRANKNKPIGTIIISAPDPPDHLSMKGQNMWTQICQELIRMGILQEIDITLLEIAVNELDIYWRCQRKLKDRLTTVDPNSGKMIMRPEVSISQRSFSNAMKILSRFGLTPSDRQKIITNQAAKPKKDDAADLML